MAMKPSSKFERMNANKIDPKAAARRKALAGAASGAAIADRNSIAKERIATKRNRLSQYVESKGIPVAPQNTKLLAKQVESGVKYKKMAGSK